jgi:quinol monooxygenase YgiN
MSKCYVTALVRPKPGSEDRVKAEILAIIPKVRAEAGCLRYDLHVQTKDGVQFLFYEIWESLAALDVHAKAPTLLAFVDRVKDMMAAPLQVDVWSGVDVAE